MKWKSRENCGGSNLVISLISFRYISTAVYRCMYAKWRVGGKMCFRLKGLEELDEKEGVGSKTVGNDSVIREATKVSMNGPRILTDIRS